MYGRYTQCIEVVYSVLQCSDIQCCAVKYSILQGSTVYSYIPKVFIYKVREYTIVPKVFMTAEFL